MSRWSNGDAYEKSDNTEVFGLDGEIVINVESDAVAWVYSLSGQLIRQQQVSQGSNSIKIPKGLYIVSVGGASYKVYVR